MIRSLGNLLYGSTRAEFKSAFGLDESVARLRQATKRSVFSVWAEQAATGPVSESKVRLQRVIPLVGNSFKPFFIGRFEVRNGAVYLSGRFTTLAFTKVFMTFWLAAVALAAIAFVVRAVETRGAQSAGALATLGMFAGGVLVVALGKWFARNDVPWLSSVIRAALQSPDDAGTLTAGPVTVPPATGAPGVPLVLRVSALVLLAYAVVCLWIAASDVSYFRAAGGKETVLRHFSSPYSRAGIGAYGLMAFGAALGVYRRRIWGWAAVLLIIAVGGVLSIVQALTSHDFPDIASMKIIFSVGSVVVAVFWGRWWYAQKIHFEASAKAADAR
jgi:hypothetical protein